MKETQMKFNYVRDLANVISHYQKNVVDINYELYLDEQDRQQEYIVVEYKGGAKSVLNVNANSFSANLRTIAKVLDGGDYCLIQDYRDWQSKVACGKATQEHFSLTFNYRDSLERFNSSGLYLGKVLVAAEVDALFYQDGDYMPDDEQFENVCEFCYRWYENTEDVAAHEIVSTLYNLVIEKEVTYKDLTTDYEKVKALMNSRF